VRRTRGAFAAVGEYDRREGAQQTALIIAQQKPFLPLRFHHSFKFRLIELDDLLLLRMNPTRENQEAELPGLQDEAHGMLGGEAEKLHHVAWADACQGPKSAHRSLLAVSQLASWKDLMVRRSFLTRRHPIGNIPRPVLNPHRLAPAKRRPTPRRKFRDIQARSAEREFNAVPGGTALSFGIQKLAERAHTTMEDKEPYPWLFAFSDIHELDESETTEEL